jgi:hypothetical protein
VELLTLISALNPREAHESFRLDDILLLANKFYPQDFIDHEKLLLKMEVPHYEQNVVRDEDFKQKSSIFELCQWLVRTRKSIAYPLVFRVILLLLTLLVSTATTKRTFSAMNIVKSRLRNKMEDEFLMNSLIVYIEKEIVIKFSIDSIIDDF